MSNVQESADRICRCLDIGLDSKDIDITSVEKFGGTKSYELTVIIHLIMLCKMIVKYVMMEV